MKKLLTLAITLAALAGVQAQTPKMISPEIVRQPKADRSGTSWFVRAPDGPLLFTGQIFATNVTLDTRAQAEEAIDNLRAELDRFGVQLSQVLRLNVYVANPALTQAVDEAIAARFRDAPPAVTLCYTPLAKPHARVAFDAVAAAPSRAPTARADGTADANTPSPMPEAARVVIQGDGALMPRGGKVFVAGQANRGANLAASVKTTMENLFRALGTVGLTKADVVQVKAFITPFADHASALDEVKKSFSPDPMPPLVFIEWVSTSPAEIELIASAPTLTRSQEEAAAFLPLPGMPTSPVFSRIATVAAGSPLIFISGLDGGENGTAREQWKRIFDQLGAVLFDSGSSFRHMVKATYFLHDEKAREMLGAIRGVYYDPTRPPSASALDVTQMARPGRLVMLDMIAVPTK